MSSARSRLLVLAAAGAFGLSGCVSTQQRAAWLHLQNRRLLASEGPTVVRTPSAAVRVSRVRLLVDTARLAVTAQLTNLTGAPLIDVPVSVGVRRPRRRLLNATPGLPFAAAHVPVIAPRGAVTWVFTAPRPHAPVDGAFVIAGAADRAVRVEGDLPALSAALLWQRGPVVGVRLSNRSSIPQPDVPVYVQAGHAAGQTMVGLLDGGAAETVAVRLIGVVTQRPQIEVIPTMYQVS